MKKHDVTRDTVAGGAAGAALIVALAATAPAARGAQAPTAPLPEAAASATAVSRAADSLPTLRMSPRVRVQLLPGATRLALEPHQIEPFLAEPLIVDEDAIRQAPRIVAAPEGRVLITRGDRAYARGPAGSALDVPPQDAPAARAAFRIFREARAVHDPVTHAVLGYEARYVGRALLVQAQGRVTGPDADAQAWPVPALLDIVSAREEIRAGDRLLPEPARQFTTYTPHAPQTVPEDARIISIYGDAAGMAGQNQVVVINKGRADGLADGHVLAVIRQGPQGLDHTGPGRPEQIQLPAERKGQLMVFRTFDRLCYGLILDSGDGVRVGDRLAAPR